MIGIFQLIKLFLANQGYGGYDFSIQSYKNNEGRMMEGGKILQLNEMTSLTTEMYGILGSIAALLLISTHFNGIDQSNGKVILTTDNQEAVDRTNKECIPMNISETRCKEYDLWKLVWDIKNLLPF